MNKSILKWAYSVADRVNYFIGWLMLATIAYATFMLEQHDVITDPVAEPVHRAMLLICMIALILQWSILCCWGLLRGLSEEKKKIVREQ